MKWILRFYWIISLAFATLANAGAAEAKDLCPPAFASLCKIQLAQQSGGVVGTIMMSLIILAAIVSLFYLIFGGARFITAAGDQGKTAQARSHIIAAIVGLIISLCSFLIVNVVMYVITGKGIGNMSIPML
jgi:hypothetical protein